MKTLITDKFVHELGPRSIRNNKIAVEILNMLDELMMIDRIIKDNPKTMKINIVNDEQLNTTELQKWKLVIKFLWLKAKFYLSPSIRQEIKAHDLTVEEFFELFMEPNSKFVTELIDPFLSGIWAGKIGDK